MAAARSRGPEEIGIDAGMMDRDLLRRQAERDHPRLQRRADREQPVRRARPPRRICRPDARRGRPRWSMSLPRALIDTGTPSARAEPRPRRLRRARRIRRRSRRTGSRARISRSSGSSAPRHRRADARRADQRQDREARAVDGEALPRLAPRQAGERAIMRMAARAAKAAGRSARRPRPSTSGRRRQRQRLPLDEARRSRAAPRPGNSVERVSTRSIAGLLAIRGIKPPFIAAGLTQSRLSAWPRPTLR